MRLWFGVVFLVMVLLFAACAGGPEPMPEEPASEEAPAEPEAAMEPEPEAEPEPETEPEPVEEPAQEEPGPEETEEEPDPEEPIEVSEEVYEQTFDEIEATIEELNAVISARNFERWKTYLTDAYLEEYSDSQRLAEISQMPILERNDITLTSLRDYFNWVVVPSRQDARLDDLRFLSENEVYAIMNINENPVILYRLRKVDGRWKVDAA
jgi:hypothetical protein